MEPAKLCMMPRNDPWNFQENNTLFSLVKENLDSRGRPKWQLVAKGLPGRTAQQARCRWRRIEDARHRKGRGEKFRNKCHVCGQLRRGHNCPGLASNALCQIISNPSSAYTANVTERAQLGPTQTLVPENSADANPRRGAEDEFFSLEDFLDLL